MRRSTATIAVLTAALIVTSAGLPAHALEPSAAKKYGNCKALNKVFPHGVAKSASVKDRNKKKQIVADPVSNFKVNASVYAANKGLDRDKDGIACEKH